MTIPAPTDATLGPQARAVIDRELARLATPEHELAVLEGVTTHGAAFAAWLQLGRSSPEEPTCVQRFELLYGGSWRNVGYLVADTLAALGWISELTNFLNQNNIPPDCLDWDANACARRLRERFDLIELDGITHTFHR